MRTVELLEHAVAAAGRLGYRIREDWLGETPPGVCELRGQRWIFFDLGQSPEDKLDQLISALRGEPGLARLELPIELAQRLAVRKTA